MKRTEGSRKNNQQIRDKIAMILATEVGDPRLDMVTVTDASVSKDKSVCNIYVSAGPERYDEVVAGLNSAKGRIRSILGKSLGWRVTPELRFMIDSTIDEAARIERALRDVPASMAIPKDEFGQPLDAAQAEADDGAVADE